MECLRHPLIQTDSTRVYLTGSPVVACDTDKIVQDRSTLAVINIVDVVVVVGMITGGSPCPSFGCWTNPLEFALAVIKIAHPISQTHMHKNSPAEIRFAESSKAPS